MKILLDFNIYYGGKYCDGVFFSGLNLNKVGEMISNKDAYPENGPQNIDNDVVWKMLI